MCYARSAPREVGRYLHGLGSEDDLFLRCALDDREAVERAIRAGPEALTALDGHMNAASARGATLLHLAASLSNHAMAELLLDLGADPDTRARDGEVPLHYAARFGDRRMVELLLARGADPTLRDSVQDATPAAWADFFGQGEVLPLLNG